MKVSIEYVSRRTRPRREGGCDWEAERIVLLRMGTKELWWWKAGKEWTGLLNGYQSRPAELKLVDFGKRSDGYPDKNETLHDGGGRLSIGLVHKHAKAIDEWFGHKLACVVDIKRTAIASLVPRDKAEALVDAIGEALGVDTGTCGEELFAAAVAAANKILEG